MTGHQWVLQAGSIPSGDVPHPGYDLGRAIITGDPHASNNAMDAASSYVKRGVAPDYVSINPGFLGPMLPKIPGLRAGGQGQLVVDRYGNMYAAPGGQIGVGKQGLGGSVNVGYLDRNQGVPNEKDLKDWMQGYSYNGTIGGGRLPTAGITVSHGNHGWEPALELGLGSRQAGVNGVYDYKILNAPGAAWDHDQPTGAPHDPRRRYNSR